VFFGARPECDQPVIDVQNGQGPCALKKLGIDVWTEWARAGDR